MKTARGIRLSAFSFHLSTLISLLACLGGTFTQPAHGEPATPSTPAAATNAVRTLDETELLTLLTDTLQRDYIKTRGELELRLTRPWTPIRVPSSASPVPRSEFRVPSSENTQHATRNTELTLKILELPNAGVTASCIVRCELRSGDQKLGEWQLPLQAHIWREAWVARALLKRGDNLADADLARERRDIINIREPLAEFAERDPAFELAEPIQNNGLLLARSVRLRPVIRRGQLADALVEDGALRVVMKVEALEDGAPGQVIRARNPQTRRDLRGKVLNEQTIALSL